MPDAGQKAIEGRGQKDKPVVGLLVVFGLCCCVIVLWIFFDVLFSVFLSFSCWGWGW